MSDMTHLNPTTRFSNRVENYVKYRPHYPASVTDFLKKECGLQVENPIADIGSGTGISSELFLENGNTLYGIEPNDDMRKAAEVYLGKYKNFISVNGSAEETTLGDSSVDFIIAGQAFHWFDKGKCKPEFKRILKENGYITLMWNLRDRNSKFMEMYENILIKYGKDYAKLYQDDVDEDEIKKFFLPVKVKKASFPNFQELDYNALQGRLLSSSYIPLAESPGYNQMIDDLKNIFESNNENGKVKMEYETVVYYGVRF